MKRRNSPARLPSSEKLRPMNVQLQAAAVVSSEVPIAVDGIAAASPWSPMANLHLTIDGCVSVVPEGLDRHPRGLCVVASRRAPSWMEWRRAPISRPSGPDLLRWS